MKYYYNATSEFYNSDLEFFQLHLLRGFVRSWILSDICHFLHLLQPVGDV